MFYYALGSILFAFAFMAAFTVMAQEFARHWRTMKAALRSLSLDGLDTRSAEPTISLPRIRPIQLRPPRAA